MTEFKPMLPPEGINSLRENPISNILLLLLGCIISLGLVYYALVYVSEFAFEQINEKYEVKITEFFRSKLDNNYFSDEKNDKNTDIKSETSQEYALKNLGAELWQPYNKTKRPEPIFGKMETELSNAFTFPGGYIQVTSGLLEKSTSENELAFVICHELGHHFYRHPLKQLGRHFVFMLSSALIELTTGSGGIFAFGLQLTSLSHSRSQEEEADSFALGCLNSKYGHVKGFEAFFNQLKDEQGILSNNKITKYMSTHPISEERISRLIDESGEKNFDLDGPIISIKPYQEVSSSESEVISKEAG